MVVLLPKDHVLEVGALEGGSEARLLQQLQHAQAVREDNVLAEARLAPVLQVVEVLDKGRVVQVAVLREVVQVLRVGQRLNELELCL